MMKAPFFLTNLIFLVSFGTLVAANPINDLDKIAKANRYKERATEALEEGDYQLAISSYHYLLDSMGIDESELVLNLGHCYYQIGDAEQATKYYQELASDPQNRIRAVANQQLGVMQAEKQELDSALEHLKTALKSDPSDEKIRYDYVTVKKMAEEQKKKEEQNKEDKQEEKDDQKQENEQNKEDQQKKDQQDKDQENQQKQDQQQEQDQQQQDKKDQEKQDQQQKDQQQKEGEEQDQQQKDQQQQEGEQEKKPEQEQTAEEKKKEEQRKKEQMQQQRMEQINMTPEKAKMILEALKNQEVQYYQQMKRKAKPKESDKPDW